LIEIGPMPAGGSTAAPAQPRSRLTERHVLALGLGISGVFVALAVAAAGIAAATGASMWPALHLALAGAATTAIGTFIPHFAITLAGTRPQPPALRVAGIVLLGAGGAAAVAGVTTGLGGAWALAGSAAVIGGLMLTAQQTLAPLRNPLARRHPIVTVTYLVAIGEMSVGVALGGLAAAGFAPVTAAWLGLRAAHAWLTLFGAVSVTIFGTLVYLAPTVLGARIRPSAVLVIGTTGMLSGPIVAAAGFAAGIAPLVVGGAGLTLLGAAGQLAYVVDSIRRRGPYSSEHDWRRVAVWHLVAGAGWFSVASVVALVDLVAGRSISGWSIGVLGLPLVAGWMLQELVGSWTHLVPSVTPGDAATHARQRRVLARGSHLRPIGWNVGLGLAWLGLATGTTPVAALGSLLLAAAIAVSVVLLGRSLTLGPY
jgi:hypothetical protein